jgi:uncharacterized phage-associated protein
MADVQDVAAYLLKRRAMTAMQLQKVVYYAQGWHLAWTGDRLFAAPIEAWANGPVVRELYDLHHGQFGLSSWPTGDTQALSDSERGTVDQILSTYGTKSAEWLSERTHSELPWREARTGLPLGARSNAEIDPATMRSFFSSEAAAGRLPERVVSDPQN